MKASEAAAMAKFQNTSSSKSQYSTIAEQIKTAAFKGLYSINYYDSLKQDVEDKLVEDGYEVKTDYARNEVLVSISWK